MKCLERKISQCILPVRYFLPTATPCFLLVSKYFYKRILQVNFSQRSMLFQILFSVLKMFVLTYHRNWTQHRFSVYLQFLQEFLIGVLIQRFSLINIIYKQLCEDVSDHPFYFLHDLLQQI